jgi:hypothetical protein
MMPGGFQSKAESRNSTSAAWRAQRARRLDLDTGGDDRWKDRVIVLGVVLVSLVYVQRQESIIDIECVRQSLRSSLK